MLAAEGEVDEGGIDRSAWRYTEKGGSVTIYALGEKRWTAKRDDGKKPNYLEVGRTEEYVELQNQDTKLFVRLHAERAFWRRPKDEKWTRWVKGEWVGEPPEGEPLVVYEIPETPQPAAPRSKSPASPPPKTSVPASPVPAAASSASPSERAIRVAYFVPKDRKPAKNYEKKIGVVTSVVAELYAMDFQRKGLKNAGIRWESIGGEPVIHRVAGQRDAAWYNNAPAYDANEQWRRIVPEIRAKVGSPQKQLIVVFAETYDDAPSDALWPGVMARGAYYSADGGLAIYSAHLLRDEFCTTTLDGQRKKFFDTTPVPGRKALGHRMNSPRCEFVEDGFGAVAHELGHALGLPHDRREDDWEIMGNGFRNLRRNFDARAPRPVAFSEESASLLMSSRYVASDLITSDLQPPKVEVTLQGKSGMTQSVRVQAADNTGLRAIVFFDRAAGSIVTGKKLSGKSQQITQKLPLVTEKGQPTDLQVIVTDDGGHQTRKSVSEE